jgi:RNase H-like domain found in reverse transcriptase/Reverse transcriptase (RNA-dependent DNA polymerase)/Integrase zinc binding domain
MDSKSLIILSRLFPAQLHVTTQTLVDSGCSARAFCDRSFVHKFGIQTTTTPFPRTLLLADGKEASTKVDQYFVAPMAIGNHEELCLFFVTDLLPETPVILGLPWLQQHNPAIDWARLSLSFTSPYCRDHCCPPWLDPTAPTVPAPAQPQPPIEPKIRRTTYQPPSVEDVPEEPPPPQDEAARESPIQMTLSPGTHPTRTHPVGSPSQETRAVLIPSTPLYTRPAPAPFLAGQRRRGKPLPKEHPMPSGPPPEDHSALPQDEQPDLTDIKMVNALQFAKFGQGHGTRIFKMTWDELDNLSTKPAASIHIPDIPEQMARDVLLGRGDKLAAARLFPPELHEFLADCYSPLRLAKISESDIEKFMKGKPELSTQDVSNKLPTWLHDKLEGFLPKNADAMPPRRPWDHKIELTPGKEPPYQKSRPLSPAELQVVRKWLDENLEKGYIRESRARCAAPLLLAAKPGGGVRICQDYRGLNSVTIKNRYPLPLIRETLDAICRAKVYTKLDVVAAFNKLRIAEGHEWKTAFITRFGLFESLVMPFGLCNAPASFQHYINHTLFDLLDKFCTAYLDDVLIYSTSKSEHRDHVREVVSRLIDAGLQIDINKCEFETTRTKYLGLIITPGGIEMDPKKVVTIRDWKAPSTVRDLQRFLGFANFYRRFIRSFSLICCPLNDLLKKGAIWEWQEPQEAAFNNLKSAFITAPVLAMFDYDRRTVLETDASDWASGGVLSQYDDTGILRPVAYFSSKHSSTECNYEIYDKELLAIIKCLEEWRPELQGTQESFEILTDHKNLEYFTTTKALNQRQVRWSEFLSGFNFKIIYRPGPKAIRPDALSRKSEDRPSKTDPDDDRIKNRQRTLLTADRFAKATFSESFDAAQFEELLSEANAAGDLSAAPVELFPLDNSMPLEDIVARAYDNSILVQTMAAALKNPLLRRWPNDIRKTLQMAMSDCQLKDGRIYYRNRLFVPPDDELKVQILCRYHSSGLAGHPGKHKTIELITRDFWWPRLTRDVQAYVRACELCTRTKASRSSPAGFLQPLPMPFRAWSDISVDYITPLPDCERDNRKYKHIAVVVCRLTKMRHFMPTQGLSAEELANAFVARIYCLHGAPETIVSDRGTQFISEFWKELSSRLSITLHHSSAYHPETDGQTERLNAVLEQYLRAFMNFAQDDWVDWLPLAEFASNNAVSETTGYSPFFANYGFHPRLGFEPRTACSPDKTPQQKKEFMKAHSIADRFDRILTQLKALAAESGRRYEENANASRVDAPRYTVGQRVWLSTKNMKTNRPMKKGDDKWAGPFLITAVYPRACALKLPKDMKLFPVFHNSLLQPHNEETGLPGQNLINAAESKHLRGRVLEREDGVKEPVEKWEFDAILDSHDENGLNYLVKWKHHKPSWQPAHDLKGQDQALWRFHDANPTKAGPPRWLRRPRAMLPPAMAPPADPLRRSARLATTIRRVAFAATQCVTEVDRWIRVF